VVKFIFKINSLYSILHNLYFSQFIGAILSFRQNTLNFTKSLEIIKKYGKLIKDFGWLPKDSGISFVRIDNDDFHPLYQVFFLN